MQQKQRIMKYAIIAAGKGSRLAQEGEPMPKPLVKVGNECLIDRLIRIFMDNHAEEIVVICNEDREQVHLHLQNIQRNGLNGMAIPLCVVQKSTTSSMHSLFEISPYLCHSVFCLTTVDTIFSEKAFQQYIHQFQQQVQQGTQAFMAVTKFIDDEKPLYVKLDENMRIQGFYDDNTNNCTYISGGIYGLQPICLQVLKQCIEHGEQRMRNFQRALITQHLQVKAYNMECILDIDHVSDIKKAEQFVATQQ